MPEVCLCGYTVGRPTSHPLHWHHCPLYRPIHTQGHHSGVKDLQEECTSTGNPSIREPPEDGGTRADLSVQLLLGQKDLDLAYTDCTAPSYATGASKNMLSAAAKREKQKITHHQANSASHGATFSPFVIERLGGWGNYAVAFAKTLAEEACGNGLGEYATVYKRVVEVMSVSMHKANHRTVSQGLKDSRFHAVRAARNSKKKFRDGASIIIPSSRFYSRLKWRNWIGRRDEPPRRYSPYPLCNRIEDHSHP